MLRHYSRLSWGRPFCPALPRRPPSPAAVAGAPQLLPRPHRRAPPAAQGSSSSGGGGSEAAAAGGQERQQAAALDEQEREYEELLALVGLLPPGIRERLESNLRLLQVSRAASAQQRSALQAGAGWPGASYKGPWAQRGSAGAAHQAQATLLLHCSHTAPALLFHCSSTALPLLLHCSSCAAGGGGDGSGAAAAGALPGGRRAPGRGPGQRGGPGAGGRTGACTLCMQSARAQRACCVSCVLQWGGGGRAGWLASHC